MAYDTKYNYMESTLQKINRDGIQLEEALQRKNNRLVMNVLSQIISKMREDKLFNELYSTPFYGGSYYCGLKVGKPDEYDLDMLLRLPVYAQPQIEVSDEHAFVWAKFLNMTQFDRNVQLSSRYPNFRKYLLDQNDYLVTDKVLRWIESLVNKALNSLNWVIYANDTVYQVELHKHQPAFTLILINQYIPDLSIDLVPSFAFKNEHWPIDSYRQNPVPDKNEFFIVPKNPRKGYLREPFRYWRISFMAQENAIINNLNFLKCALKLLKKLRDEFDHKAIASYYIKTIFIWEKDAKDNNFWNSSLSYVFMSMLKKYQQYVEDGFIPDYWNSNYNLIGHVPKAQLQIISNTLKYMIQDIDRNLGNPNCILKYFTRTIHLKKTAEPAELSNDYTIIEPSGQSNDSWCIII